MKHFNVIIPTKGLIDFLALGLYWGFLFRILSSLGGAKPGLPKYLHPWVVRTMHLCRPDEACNLDALAFYALLPIAFSMVGTKSTRMPFITMGFLITVFRSRVMPIAYSAFLAFTAFIFLSRRRLAASGPDSVSSI